jgi:polar amino acid transport system permease protein
VESGLGHETAFTDGPEPIGDDDSAQLRSSARPGSFEVRAVTEDDPDLARMLRELEREYSARYGAAGDELARYPSSRFHPPEGESLLLFEDGVCVAGGAFIHLDDETVELKRIWTDRSRRGRGLARRLLTALETAAAERGYRRVFLTTGPRQPEARALYLATGYTPLFDLTADPEWVGPLPFEKKLQAP